MCEPQGPPLSAAAREETAKEMLHRQKEVCVRRVRFHEEQAAAWARRHAGYVLLIGILPKSLTRDQDASLRTLFEDWPL